MPIYYNIQICTLPYFPARAYAVKGLGFRGEHVSTKKFNPASRVIKTAPSGN